MSMILRFGLSWGLFTFPASLCFLTLVYTSEVRVRCRPGCACLPATQKCIWLRDIEGSSQERKDRKGEVLFSLHVPHTGGWNYCWGHCRWTACTYQGIWQWAAFAWLETRSPPKLNSVASLCLKRAVLSRREALHRAAMKWFVEGSVNLTVLLGRACCRVNLDL